MEIVGVIGFATAIAAGLAGFKGWSWSALIIILLVAIVWYAVFQRSEIASDLREEGGSALVRHFGTIPIPLGVAWLIGYGLTVLF